MIKFTLLLLQDRQSIPVVTFGKRSRPTLTRAMAALHLQALVCT